MKKISIILILFILIYIVPLSVRPMVIPDETRYAEISREMVETGDWIVPRLNGLRYFEKPVLGYWLHSFSIKILGENAFAMRLPSALAVGISATILFFLVHRFTSDIITAIIASSVFLTCLEVFVLGTFCVLDSIFSMFITASMAAFFFAFMEVRSLRRIFFLLIFGISCGLAFLTKGFLAFVITAIVLIPFSIWQGQLKKMIRLIWLPIIVAVLILLPWSIMIYLREPDFWHYFFWMENIDRFISPNGGQHPHMFLFYIPIILLGTLPWTFQIIGALSYGIRKKLFNNPLMRLCICWFVFPFVFLSISHGKLETYILPCFPPLIIFFSISLRHEYKAATNERFNHSNKIGIVLVILLLTALIITQTLVPATKIYFPNEVWKVLFLVFGLLVYAGSLIYSTKTKNRKRKLVFSFIAPVMLIAGVPFVVPNQIIERKAPIDFISQYKDRINPDIILVSDNYLTPAVCWCYKRIDVFLLEITGEFEYGLGEEGSTKQRLLSIDQLKELVSQNPDQKDVILITSVKRYKDYKQHLPQPVFESIENGFVFEQFRPGTFRSF